MVTCIERCHASQVKGNAERHATEGMNQPKLEWGLPHLDKKTGKDIRVLAGPMKQSTSYRITRKNRRGPVEIFTTYGLEGLPATGVQFTKSLD